MVNAGKVDASRDGQGCILKKVYISNLFNSASYFYYSALGEHEADYDTIQ